MLRGLFRFLWRQLPDKCEMKGCTRMGVRGNENIVIVGYLQRVMCQECTTVHLIRWNKYADEQDRAIDAMNEDEATRE